MKCPRCDTSCATSGKLFVCLHCHWVGGEEQDLPSRRPVRKPAIPRQPSELEQALSFQLRAYGDCGEWVPEFRYSPTRMYRADFAWPDLKLLVEIEGGTKGVIQAKDGKLVPGRHNRNDGFEKDCEKYNEATLMGFRVLRFTSGMVKDGRAIAVIRKALVRLQEEQCSRNP